MEIRIARPGDTGAVIAAYEWLFAPPGSTPPDWDPQAWPWPPGAQSAVWIELGSSPSPQRKIPAGQPRQFPPRPQRRRLRRIAGRLRARAIGLIQQLDARMRALH